MFARPQLKTEELYDETGEAVRSLRILRVRADAGASLGAAAVQSV